MRFCCKFNPGQQKSQKNISGRRKETRDMKKICRCISGTIRKFFKETINGTKGVVSLFLAIIMLPLLSISLLLVEFSRYQNTIHLVNELMDSSAFSTLAEYDSYLEKRFGLLAVSQEKEIKDTFTGYLDANVGSIGKSITVTKNNAEGGFALSDTDVLKQQLLECSEISVVSETVLKGFDIDELFRKLKNSFEWLTNFSQKIQMLNKASVIAGAAERLLSNAQAAKEQFDDRYNPALETCKRKYKKFETKAVAWIDALNNAEANLAEGQDYNTIYDNADVKNALEEIKTAGKSYKSAVKTLKRELNTLKTKIEGMLAAAREISDGINDYNDALAAINDTPGTTSDMIAGVARKLLSAVDSAIAGGFTDTANRDIQKLERLIRRLNDLVGHSEPSNDDAIKEKITSDWTVEDIKNYYGLPQISSVKKGLFDTIKSQIIDYLTGSPENTDGWELAKKFFDIVKELVKIKTIYDTNLNSVVGTSCFYENDVGMSFTARALLTSLQLLIGTMEALKNPIVNLLAGVLASAAILAEMVTFIIALVAWIGRILINIVNYICNGPKELYNSLILYGYGTYNLPNRRTFYEKKTLSGSYKFKDIYYLAGGSSYDATTGGSFENLNDILQINNYQPNNRLFKGAESEYLLVGSTSEICNQSIAFLYLYFLRLGLDIIPVLTKTPGEFVVKIVAALAEPLLDTMILVNGGNEYMIKLTPYLSPTGVLCLFKDIIGMTAFSQNFQHKIHEAIQGHWGEGKKDGFFKADYTEHIMLLLMLTVPNDVFLKRMQNIIQMETAADYAKTGQIGFKLNRAYTYIQTDVEYTLNPLFNVAGLLDNGLFTVSSNRYSGY